MDELYKYVSVISAFVVLIVVIVVLHLRYRRSEKEKNRGIFLQIQEQTRLARELEHARIENRTLEKLLRSVINQKTAESTNDDRNENLSY